MRHTLEVTHCTCTTVRHIYIQSLTVYNHSTTSSTSNSNTTSISNTNSNTIVLFTNTNLKRNTIAVTI